MLSMIDFYKGIIKIGDVVADDEDMLSTSHAQGKPSAWTITGRRLVLPSKKQLSNPDWEHRLVFHPLVESQVGGESVVFERFRRCINNALNLRVAYLFSAMSRMCLSTNVEKRNTLGAAYNDMFNAMNAADDKFHTSLGNIFGKNVQLIHTFTRRGMTVAGNSMRVGSETYFPFLDELKSTKTRVIEGVKFRVDDVPMLIKMYEFVFPGCSQGKEFRQGSDSPSVPTLLAQALNTVELLKRLNYLFETLPALEGESLIVDLSDADKWFGDISTAINEANAVGMLEGNTAKPKKNAQTPSIDMTAVSQAVQAAPVQTPVAQAVAQVAPVQQPHVVIGTPQPQAASAPMSNYKIGSPAPSSSGGINVQAAVQQTVQQPRVIPTVHIGQQQQAQPMLINTGNGIAAVNPVSMEQAKEIAMRQQIAQQEQLQAQQQAQMKLMQAQSMGYQVTQSPTGPLVMVSDGKNGVQYVPINQWEPPAQTAGGPAVLPGMQPQVAGVMPVAAVPAIVPTQAAAAVTPGGTVSIEQWMASNPMMAANYNQNYMQQMQAQQMQQQMQQLQQMAAMGMNVQGMMPAMMPGMMPGMMQGVQQAAYVPTHQRAAALMPAGMITPVGGIR